MRKLRQRTKPPRKRKMNLRKLRKTSKKPWMRWTNSSSQSQLKQNSTKNQSSQESLGTCWVSRSCKLISRRRNPTRLQMRQMDTLRMVVEWPGPSQAKVVKRFNKSPLHTLKSMALLRPEPVRWLGQASSRVSTSSTLLVQSGTMTFPHRKILTFYTMQSTTLWRKPTNSNASQSPSQRSLQASSASRSLYAQECSSKRWRTSLSIPRRMRQLWSYNWLDCLTLMQRRPRYSKKSLFNISQLRYRNEFY